jgi:V8-like Glu-specific endopeptidase
MLHPRCDGQQTLFDHATRQTSGATDLNKKKKRKGKITLGPAINSQQRYNSLFFLQSALLEVSSKPHKCSEKVGQPIC